jgi:hypothetical protein
MTQNQPVTRVVDILTNAGYHQRTTPVTVASVRFEFAALLLGSDRANDLIIVIDTLVDSEVRVRQKVEGLSRALDLVASRRPLTVVLVGPPPRPTIVEALARVSRVLTVGTPTGDNADRFLADTLAVLLPLSLPDVSESVVDPLGEVRRQLPTDIDQDALVPLFAAAPRGTEAVQEALRELLEASLDLDSQDSAS